MNSTKSLTILKHLANSCSIHLLRAGIIFVLCLFAVDGYSEEKFQSFPLLHAGIKEEQLPGPGLPLNLEVVLPKESFGYELIMQAQVYRDGELWDLYNLLPDHDEQDRLIYSAIIPSPRKELRYIFTFSNRRGFLQRSAEYQVKRSCEPDLQLTPDTRAIIVDRQIPSREILAALLDQAGGLEKDIQVYERAIEIATELKRSIEKK